MIASRGDLDLGVRTLINREHALLLALGDLRVGRTVDAQGRASGQADRLENASATIEVSGHAHIAAAAIENRNAHYASQAVPTETRAKVYYRPVGSTDRYDAATTWLGDLVTPLCSKDPAWLGKDQERRLLLPSERYPEARYGPPFDYVRTPRRRGFVSGFPRRRGETAPIAPPYRPERQVDRDDGVSRILPAQYYYPPEARIWQVFGVAPPTTARPERPPWSSRFRRRASADAQPSAAQQQALADFEAAQAVFQAPYRELDAHLRAFNADYDARLVKNFLIYRVTETVTESRTVASDPGQLRVGGDAHLIGSVLNDKS